MQQMVLCWCSGLRVAGGALGLPKCCWGLIAFCWDAGSQWQCRLDIYHNLQIPDENGALAAVARLDPSTPTPVEAMGAWQSVNGVMAEQVKALKEKVTNLGEMIKKGRLPRSLVWQPFCAMIWPSLRRCLPATTLAPNESDKITKGLYKHFLPSSGTNHHFLTMM